MKSELYKIIHQLIFQEKLKDFEGKAYYDLHSTVDRNELVDIIFNFVVLYQAFNEE